MAGIPRLIGKLASVLDVRGIDSIPNTRAAATAPGQWMEIEFHDSRRTAVMDGEGPTPRAQTKQKKTKKKPPSPSGNDNQGTLL